MAFPNVSGVKLLWQWSRPPCSLLTICITNPGECQRTCMLCSTLEVRTAVQNMIMYQTNWFIAMLCSQPWCVSVTGLSIVSTLPGCVSCCCPTVRSFSQNLSNKWKKNKYQGFMCPLEKASGDSTFQRLRNPWMGTSGPTCTVVGPFFRLIYKITNQTVHKKVS